MNAQYVRNKQVVVVTGTTRTVTKAESGTLFTTVGAAGATTFTLPADSEVGDTYQFVVGVAQTLTIAHGKSTDKFVINGGVQAADKDISANDENESVTITKVDSTTWVCAPINGTWDVEV